VHFNGDQAPRAFLRRFVIFKRRKSGNNDFGIQQTLFCSLYDVVLQEQ